MSIVLSLYVSSRRATSLSENRRNLYHIHRASRIVRGKFALMSALAVTPRIFFAMHLAWEWVVAAGPWTPSFSAAQAPAQEEPVLKMSYCCDF